MTTSPYGALPSGTMTPERLSVLQNVLATAISSGYTQEQQTKLVNDMASSAGVSPSIFYSNNTTTPVQPPVVATSPTVINTGGGSAPPPSQPRPAGTTPTPQNTYVGASAAIPTASNPNPTITNYTSLNPITPAQMQSYEQQQQMQMPAWASAPPAWLNDMQSWWSGMQQQQKMPATSGAGGNGYVNNAFPQYTPNYGENALMRPITPNSGITGQNQYGNMGFNNKRSSLWGDW